MQSSTTRRVIAMLVTIGGVVAILAVNAARQRDQGVELGRQWIGEQWDVARNCLLGTPIGRGEGEAAIARRLEARLIEALVSASEQGADPASLWPARCTSSVARLDADRSVMRRDPGDAVAQITVLAPRVLSTLDLEEGLARARELAGPIAALDRAMPPGAEYEVADYREPDGRLGPEHVLASCAIDPPRPFLASDGAAIDALRSAGGRIELTRDGEGFRTSAAPEAQIAGEGRPLLWDEDTLLWIREGSIALRDLGAQGDSASAPIAGGVEDAALCRAGDVAHLVVRRSGSTSWIAWQTDGAPPSAMEVEIGRDAILACDARALAIAWRSEDAWRGGICRDDRCDAIPPLEAGDDLRLALRGDRLLAIASGRRTAGLRLARVLEGETWSDPVPIARGELSATGAAFRVEGCGRRIESADGLRWR